MSDGPRLEVGVKYCGGCNPRYDRVALARRLEAACPFARFSPASPEQTWDVLLVRCGCSACCAGVEGIQARLGRLVVSGPEGEGAALEFLRGKI